MELIPDYGDIFTMQEFIEDCENGCLIDYDGIGFYSFEDMITDHQIRPSDVMEGKHDTRYTHVVWFNR